MAAYLLLRFCQWLWQRLPLSFGYALASWFADVTFFFWRFHRRRRENMIENMRHVLGPGAEARRVERTARQSLRNYLKYMVDFCRLPATDPEELERRVFVQGWESLDQALAEGKGVIFIGLHMGSWDVAGVILTSRKYPINVVAETIAPPRLNQLVQQMRQRAGLKIIPLEKVTRQVLQVLRRNEVLALLIDRPSPENGVAVRFFNALTRVPAGAAVLALKTGAKVIPAGLVRRPDNTFVGMIDHYIHFQPSGDLRRDVQELTQLIMGSLERMVSAYPDQWYMFRRMWS